MFASLYLIALVSFPHLSSAQWEHGNSDSLFTFITRPDLKPSRWNLTVYHPELLAPGYWFVSPYVSPRDKMDETDTWVGPHIYDGNGELVWSGTEMFSAGKSTMSFQLHNVRGEDLMTTLDWDTGEIAIWDDHYEVVETIDAYRGKRVNSHELHFVDNGSKAVVMKTKYEPASLEETHSIGLYNGKPCHADWDGIEEYDTATWQTTWEWNPQGRVFLNESTYVDTPVEKRCNMEHLGWDALHCNSIDKTTDGDYFLSCRHTNTIYKISHKDGSIVWRFGGLMSDFDQGDLLFGRQHNIRIREENGTHTIISFLDNAKGNDDQPPSHDFSRGLLIALDEKNMKSTVLREMNHPDLDYTPKRGNYQVLPNDNIFMGWSTHAMHSEHSPDGTLLMQARMEAGWLGSYRNFKFPFVGQPLSAPDVHSAGYGVKGRDAARTVVHVSWNGATEVETWRFYKTIGTGQAKEVLGTVPRSGFETMLEVEGYASYVIVEGLDKSGAVLGTSSVFKSMPHLNMTAAAVEVENLWLLKANQEGEAGAGAGAGADKSAGSHAYIDAVEPHTGAGEEDSEEGGKHMEETSIIVSVLRSQVAAFIIGFVSCGTIGVVVWLTWRRGLVERIGGTRYRWLQNGMIAESYEDEGHDEDETMVEDLESHKLLHSSEKELEPPDKYDV